MEKREENQLTLSGKVGVSQPQIYHYLIGKSTPRPLVRQRLAYGLKIGYPWLIWGEGQPKVEMKRYPVEEFWCSFSERLIFALWNNGYNAPEFAKELKVSSTTVQFWLEGERSPKKEFIPFICQLLNVKQEWLLQEDGK